MRVESRKRQRLSVWLLGQYDLGDGQARADDFLSDAMIDVVNADDDTSVDALTTWLAELERDADWIDLPTTAAELIAEDRGPRGS